MAIYFASYFEPQNWHGQPVAISLGVPAGLADKVSLEHPLRGHLAPSKNLLGWWKRQEERLPEMGVEFPSEQVIEQYKAMYREEIRSSMPVLKDWLQGNGPVNNQTWLCYERAGEFCHRNLVAAIVERFRPDQFGGCDIPYVDPPDVPLHEPSVEPPSPIVMPEPVADLPLLPGDLHQGTVLRLKPEFRSDRAYKLLSIVMPVPGPGELPGPLCELEGPGGVKSFWFLSQLEVAE